MYKMSIAKKKIFFDFDGTLVDNSYRIYILFSTLVENNSLSYTKYWSIRRNGVSQKQILMNYFGYTEKNVAIFQKKWMNLIESDEFLELDKLQEKVKFVLSNIFKEHNIYIVTARQFNSKVQKQVDKFKIDKYFKEIFVTQQKSKKNDIIIKNVKNICKQDVIIGDSNEDIETGKQLNITTVAVTTGNLNKKAILKFAPDFVYDNLMEFYYDNKTL